MNDTQKPVRILLWFAIAWGMLLVALSFVAPIVTILTGIDGPQPRISLVAAYGLIGAAPAAAFLAVALIVAGLLGFGLQVVPLGLRLVARIIAALAVLTGLATTVTLLLGLFTLPLDGALLGATLLARPPRPRIPQPARNMRA